jgi:hypothetical protein
MADKLIRNFTTTTTSPAADDYLALDGATNNTRKILADKFATTANALLVANDLSDVNDAATSRDNLGVDSSDEVAESTGTKLVSPSLYFDGSNDFLEIADDDKLTFSTLTEFGKTTAGTWAAATNTPALTDGTGTVDDHYKIDADGTVAQGGSTLSIINGVAATAGQVVYYDGAVWRIKDADDLAFSISGWVNFDSIGATQPIITKYGASSAVREWSLYVDSNGKLSLLVTDTSGNAAKLVSDTVLAANTLYHVAASYAGAGPNSSSAFTANMSGGNAALYINAVVESSPVATDNASFVGMSNTTQPAWLGRISSTYLSGHIKDVKVFNRELTASEVVDCMNGDLGFADEWGGALGGKWTSDFSAGVDGVTSNNGTSAGNIDAIGGLDDNLRFTVDASSGTHYPIKTSILTVGKRYRVSADFYVPSTNSHVDGVGIYESGGVTAIIVTDATITQDTWVTLSGETEPANLNTLLRFYCLDGGSISFQDAGGDDVIYIRNVKVTEIGTLADFRAERYDDSTGKIYDISDNGFIGTSANLPSLVGREIPVYKTGTWTPGISFGGGVTGVTYGTQEGFYTRVGDQVTIHGNMTLTSKGSDTGTALITGLPFTSKNTTVALYSLSIGYSSNLTGLTAAPSVMVTDNATTAGMTVSGTGTIITDTTFQNTTILRFSGTYQIQ